MTNKKLLRALKRELALPVPVLKMLPFLTMLSDSPAERGSYQCKVQKVQANLDPHLLEEAHHGLAGATPALIDIDHCAAPGKEQGGSVSSSVQHVRRSLHRTCYLPQMDVVCRDINGYRIYYPVRV